MENMNANVQISDKWTRFTKELVEATDKIESQYPVNFNTKMGTITMIGILPKETKEVKAEIGKPGEAGYMSVTANLETYEWEEELANKTKKKRKTDLLSLADIPLPEILENIAKLIEIAEAARKMAILQIMTREEIVRLSIPGTGVLLADQLTNSDGISKDMDALIKKIYNVDPNALNAAIKDYDATKFSMGVKDKFMAKTMKSLSESLRFLAKAVSTNSTVNTVAIEGTGVEPTLVKQQEENVRAITSVGSEKLASGFKQVL